jgi:hypothetical protein
MSLTALLSFREPDFNLSSVAARLDEKTQADQLKWWLTSVGDMNGDTAVAKRLFLITKNAADP